LFKKNLTPFPDKINLLKGSAKKGAFFQRVSACFRRRRLPESPGIHFAL
jgi:hypothetical protein